MLYGNYTVLNAAPGRAIGGFTNTYSKYKTGGWLSAFVPDVNTTNTMNTASFPTGTDAPYSYYQPLVGGELSSTTAISGTGTISAAQVYQGKDLSTTLTGSGDISSDIQLIVSLVSSLAGTGAVTSNLTLLTQLASALAGSGDITSALSLITSIQAALSGVGTVSTTTNLTGKASLEASIFVNSGTASVNELVEGVWSALASANNTSGTMGEKLNGAGSAGDPWTTDLTSYTTPGTAGKRLKDTLTTNKFIALK